MKYSCGPAIEHDNILGGGGGRIFRCECYGVGCVNFEGTLWLEK